MVLVVVVVFAAAVAAQSAAEGGTEHMFPGLDAFLEILVGNTVALLLLDFNEGYMTIKVLTDRHLVRKADGIDVPPTIRIGPNGAQRVDRPEGGSAGVVLENDNGSVGRADVGLLGDAADLEVRLLLAGSGRGEDIATVEEGLGTATVVRHEQIWGGLVVPGVLVMAVVGDVTADAKSLGMGPLRRSEEDLPQTKVFAEMMKK